MGQNAFKTIRKPDFVACWYRFMESKSCLKNIRVGLVKNGYGHSGLSTLKLVVSQEGINGLKWFLVCWWKFRKVKSYFSNFWMVLVKNAASQGIMDEMTWFFIYQYKFRKAESYFNNYRVGIIKNNKAL